MKSYCPISKYGALAMGAILMFTAGRSAPAADLFGKWRWELGAEGGALIADKEIGRSVNATGGEQLIARLSSGPLLGGRVGLHSDLVGFKIGGGFGKEKIEVKNQYAVGFPNHGEGLVLLSGDVYVYPFRRALFDGRLKPYATAASGFRYSPLTLTTSMARRATRHSPGALARA